MGKRVKLILLFFLFVSVLMIVNVRLVYARTEQVVDDSNNNLMISFNAPDNWNSGKLSMTVLSVDWRLNGLFATTYGTKLLNSGNEPVAFFAVINAPSLANAAMPTAQKLGLISILLSQYARITGDKKLTLSDGSTAHEYSISLGYEQLQKLQLPADKTVEATLVITQQQGKTYLLVFGTVQGTIQQYQTTFANILQ